MMDPADSVFVGLLALLYSALCWLADEPYTFLDTPQPEAVVTSLEAQRHAVRSCWEGTPGRVVVTLVIDCDGEAIASDDDVAARLEEGSFVPGPSAYVVSQAVVFGVRE